MNQFFNDYFTFSRRERRGVFILTFILVILIISGRVMPYFISSSAVDDSVQISEIQAFLNEQELLRQQQFENKNDYTEEQNTIKRQKNLFFFNPNNLPEEDWLNLGLSEKQVRIIKNYESKGGKFFRKEDLQKIYGIQASLYQELEPFIQIPQKNNEEQLFTKAENTPIKSIINLNNADSLALLSLKGIGPSYSMRIIKYREALGGFTKLEQLMEVYGMSDELYQTILPHVFIEEKNMNRININICDKKELSKHPYISWNVANSLVNYREKHGLYKTVEDIKKSDLVNDELYLKLAPYLKVE
jgi:competence protein ComEA